MTEVIRPQPGPQTVFLSSPADIAVIGGAAGGGKTMALLLEPLRHIHNPRFSAVIFRRTFPQITQEGGLWEEAGNLYPQIGAVPRKSTLSWVFPSGATIRFAHLVHEKNKFDYQGAQIPLIEFDEATHFTADQFWYLLSRNRSMSGVKPYIRMSCNPDPESFVADLIEWWIDEDGYPIRERSGVLRWFKRLGTDLVWGDTREELLDPKNPAVQPKSFTFVPALLDDNKILEQVDPGYRARLMALDYVERMRLLFGNWRVKPSAGTLFNRDWIQIVDRVPETGTDCRYYDLAATIKTLKKTDPDYTASVLMRYAHPDFYIVDVQNLRAGPAEVENLVKRTIEEDFAAAREHDRYYRARWEIEPGSASMRESARWSRDLGGIDAYGDPVRLDKITRAKAFLSAAQNGRVKALQADWTNKWLDHMHNQPEIPHDDMWDATSGAFNQLMSSTITRPKLNVEIN